MKQLSDNYWNILNIHEANLNGTIHLKLATSGKCLGIMETEISKLPEDLFLFHKSRTHCSKVLMSSQQPFLLLSSLVISFSVCS